MRRAAADCGRGGVRICDGGWRLIRVRKQRRWGARDFFHFGWNEKGQFLRFLRWTGEIRDYAAHREES